MPERKNGTELSAVEPVIVYPNCKKEIRLTESLAAPLVEATRRQTLGPHLTPSHSRRTILDRIEKSTNLLSLDAGMSDPMAMPHCRAAELLDSSQAVGICEICGKGVPKARVKPSRSFCASMSASSASRPSAHAIRRLRCSTIREPLLPIQFCKQ
jgi:hypothetical protein